MKGVDYCVLDRCVTMDLALKIWTPVWLSNFLGHKTQILS